MEQLLDEIIVEKKKYNACKLSDIKQQLQWQKTEVDIRA